MRGFSLDLKMKENLSISRKLTSITVVAIVVYLSMQSFLVLLGITLLLGGVELYFKTLKPTLKTIKLDGEEK